MPTAIAPPNAQLATMVTLATYLNLSSVSTQHTSLPSTIAGEESSYHGIQGWDGKDSNNKYVKEGTYAYRIVVHTTSSGDVVQNGSLSVVYPI
jgi:flagellar hook assembly protein FlgD